MPEWIFFICIMETIIGVYIIRKAFKKRKELHGWKIIKENLIFFYGRCKVVHLYCTLMAR